MLLFRPQVVTLKVQKSQILGFYLSVYNITKSLEHFISDFILNANDGALFCKLTVYVVRHLMKEEFRLNLLRVD